MIKGKNEKYCETVRKTVGKAVNRYGLINGGDRVAVALSGGKDSFVLLETLADRRRFIPVHYDVLAVHVKIENIPYEMDRDFFESLCAKLEVPFQYRTMRVPVEGEELSPCFLCSWHRRKELFRFAAEERCNRIAFGHHMDDSIETLVLNMVYQGSISTMPPKLSMFKGEFDIIRPLMLLSDYEVARYAKIRGFPGQKADCPYGADSKREEIRTLLKQVYRMHRGAKKNLFRSMQNVQREYLPNGGVPFLRK